MPKENGMIEIEESCGNVYADLGIRDTEEILVKAQLATKIGEIIKSRRWNQRIKNVGLFSTSWP